MENYTQYSDAELAALLREGNQRAYTEVYERYKVLLYTFTLRRLGDREDAKDVVADLFLSIWARHGELEIGSSLVGYLYTAVRNRVANRFSHQAVADRYIDSFRDYLDSGIDDTDHLVRSKEMGRLIEAEIALLPERMREVFLLSRETGLTRAEIADKLGLSEQTVKAHMHHALKILKSRLGAFFFMVFF